MHDKRVFFLVFVCFLFLFFFWGGGGGKKEPLLSPVESNPEGVRQLVFKFASLEWYQAECEFAGPHFDS